MKHVLWIGIMALGLTGPSACSRDTGQAGSATSDTRSASLPGSRADLLALSTLSEIESLDPIAATAGYWAGDEASE